jgi:hypothetical protein
MKTKKSYKKNINLNLIKSDYTYSIPEMCEDFNKHKNTVNNWFKEGLEAIDDQKPRLVHGSTLKSFLDKKQSSNKHKCKEDQFFCVKCREPRNAWENAVDIVISNPKTGNLNAICNVCDSKMNKRFAIKNLDKVKEVFDVQKIHNSHLIEGTNNSGSSDLKQPTNSKIRNK